MKVIVATRSLNEKHNIIDFCENHDFADQVIVCDGGSVDGTVELASQFSHVSVYPFTLKIPFDDGSFMNPEGFHFDYTYGVAKTYDPDWIVWQGCDHRLNRALKEDILDLLSVCTHEIFYARIIYVWGTEHYFPELSQVGYYPLAFHRRCKVRAVHGVGPFHLERRIPERPDDDIPADNPYCVLHYSWPNEEVTNEKIQRYNRWGRSVQHPLESFGKVLPLEDWML